MSRGRLDAAINALLFLSVKLVSSLLIRSSLTMAEYALAVFGGVSAAYTLVEAFSKGSRRLNNCIRSIRHAVAELDNVALEALIFDMTLLRFVQSVSKAPAINPNKSGRDVKLIKLIWKTAKNALRGLQALLKKVDALRSRASFNVSAWVARVKLYFQKDMIKTLQASFSSARGSMELFVSIEALNEARAHQQKMYDMEKNATKNGLSNEEIARLKVENERLRSEMFVSNPQVIILNGKLTMAQPCDGRRSEGISRAVEKSDRNITGIQPL